MTQNPLQKLVPGAALPTSARSFNAYADAARTTGRQVFGGSGEPFLRACRIWPVKVTDNAGGGGIYIAQRGVWAPRAIDPGSDLDFDTAAIFGTYALDCYLINQPEHSPGRVGSHRIGADTVLIAWELCAEANDGLPLFATNYSIGIRDFRIKSDGTCVEATTQDADSPDTWSCKVPITQCTSTSTADLMTVMRPPTIG